MNVLERFSLQNKVVVLTGAGGIYGRGLATALAEAGATLVIASRDVSRLEHVAEEENRRGFKVVCEGYDQGQEESILSLRDRVLDRFGRVDGLVNNSVLRPMKGPEDPSSSWEESMRVNSTGLFLMIRAFGPPMCRRREGSIVNIGSIYGIVGPSLELYAEAKLPIPPPDYYFHKSGMINLTRYYAGCFGADQVRVNCISPGGFFTDQPEAFVKRYAEHTMLGRMAMADDVWGAVIFLLSDSSRYVTGANLPVDGGFTAK
jgi:NAD(P)-dependent dehydrogenase (short-subunit alcohol dehydrogenase family)